MKKEISLLAILAVHLVIPGYILSTSSRQPN